MEPSANKLLLKPLSSLEKCFLDENILFKPATDRFTVFRGQPLTFQVAVSTAEVGKKEKYRLSVSAAGPLAGSVSFRVAVSVPVHYPTCPLENPAPYLRTTPGLYPDLLRPLHYNGQLTVPVGQTQVLFVRADLPDTLEAGEYPLTVSVGEDSVTVTVRVLSHTLPPQKLIHTEWFYSDCLADFYHTEPFSPEHWRILERFIRTAVKNGINMILTPIFTPELDTYIGGERTTTQLVRIRVTAPGQYAFEKLGHKGKPGDRRLWGQITIASMLKNIVYIGHMPQLMSTSVSYKNHKRFKKDQSEWVVVHNTHPPIISQELWDRVREREKSVAQGRKTATGYTHPLSGFLYCADCGCKMKLNSVGNNKYAFNCGDHMRFGKTICFSHHIAAKTLEKIILDDIREMAQRIVLDEKAIREEFIRHNAEVQEKSIKAAKKELQGKRNRVEELSRLMQLAYEDRMKGKMPENICIGFIQKYSDEQKKLEAEIEELEAKLIETKNTIQSADDFIRNIKKYLEAPELTREMCYELIDRIIVGGLPKITGKEREIDIVYKVDIASVLRHKLNNSDK